MLYLKRVLFVLLGGIVAAEISVRILGIADVPLRNANVLTGYIPLPNQSGRFLMNDWHVNNLSMISREPYSKDIDSIIVAGDSVVFGGNPIQQSDRVGEQLDALVGGRVFAIGDGSWGFKNSIAYFLSSKDVLGDPKKVIFVLNSEDFNRPSSWRCYSTHPTSSPMSHLYFAVRKYRWPQCEVETPSDLVVPDFDIVAGLEEFFLQYPDTDVSIVLYPTRSELKAGISFEAELEDVHMKFGHRIKMFDLGAAYRKSNLVWGEHFYRDDIHPNPAGAKALAVYIYKNAL